MAAWKGKDSNENRNAVGKLITDARF